MILLMLMVVSCSMGIEIRMPGAVTGVLMAVLVRPTMSFILYYAVRRGKHFGDFCAWSDQLLYSIGYLFHTY